MKESIIAYKCALEDIDNLYMYIKESNIFKSKYDLKQIKIYCDDISFFIKEYYKLSKLESKMNLINSLERKPNVK